MKQKGVIAEETGDNKNGELPKVKKTILQYWYTIRQVNRCPTYHLLIERSFYHAALHIYK